MGLGLVDDLGTNACFTGKTVDESTSETGYVGCELGISDYIGHGEGNKMVFNLYPDTEFHGSNSIDRSSRYGLLRSFSEEIEDVEVSSSTGSLNSISGKVATLDYENQFEAEDDYLNIQIPQLQNLETGYMDANSTSDYESLEMVEYDTPMVSLTRDTDKRQWDINFEDIGSATKSLPAVEWLPDSGKIQKAFVSDFYGVDTSHVDSESVKASTVQLRSDCSDRLNDNGVLGNMLWDQPEILPGQSNGNQKYSVAKILDENNGLEFLLPWSRCPGYACHSPTEVSGDSNANPIIPDDVEVLGAVLIDPDMKMRENLKSLSLSTDYSSNCTEIATEALDVVPHSLAIEETERCDARYEERIDSRSGSEERGAVNNSTFLTGTDGKEVCSITSESVESSSLPMKNPSGITFREDSQEDLNVGKDSSVQLIDDIVQSSKLCSPVSHLVDQSEKPKMEIREMVSPVDFPICLEGSDVAAHDTLTLKMVSVDDPVVHHNHDTPLHPWALKPEIEYCETPASSKSAGKDYNDLLLIDENNLQVGHGASMNHDMDAVYCTENSNKDDGKHEKMERHIGASKSKPRKMMLLKSVAGGVTLLGVFLLFQLRRKSGGEKIDETSVPSIRISKTNSSEASKRNRQQVGKADTVYPGEKLRF